jgi:hypothetical protein
MSEGDETVFIGWEAGSEPTTGEPLVVMHWAHKVKPYPVDRVLATARDVYAAAAAAEADAAVFATATGSLGVDERTAAMLMRDVREHRTALQERGGAKPVLRVGAVFGAKTRRALVQFHSGSLNITISASEARENATRMVEAAVAASIDVRFRYALGEVGLDVVAIEDVFKAVRGLDRSSTAF